MFAFWDKRIYRRQFTLYTIALIVTSLLVCGILIRSIITSEMDLLEEEITQTFTQTEKNITEQISKIDNYFEQLYLSPDQEVLNDLFRFMGNDAEGYTLQRFEEIPAHQFANQLTFFDHITEFISANDYAIQEIRIRDYQSPDFVNIIRYEQTGHSEIHYLIPFDDTDTEHTDISKGYRYLRPIKNSFQLEPIGEIELIIRPQAIITNQLSKEVINLVLIDQSENQFVQSAKNTSQFTEEQVLDIYYRTRMTGVMQSEPFCYQYYSTHPSESYNYTLIALVDFQEILLRGRSVIILSVLGVLGIAVFVTILIALRMSYDARSLERIMDAIGAAKTGKLTFIELGKKREDEYDLISREFNEMSDQLQDYINREYLLKLKQKEAEMKLLQQQINPHFLYNTLEIIRSRALINEDRPVADAVSHLGNLYRSIVRGEDIITLEQELELLKQYLSIMQFKLDGTFFYQIDVAETMRSMQTIKFWLQPLVENFFVHGFDNKSEYNLVIIRGTETEKHFIMEIMNNGAKIEEQKRLELNERLQNPDSDQSSVSGIGLQNVLTRLRYFYGQSLSMQFQNNPEAGITIEIMIQKQDQ